MKWHQILKDLSVFECNETDTRPTEKGERADLYTAYSIDCSATELEHLNLLNALVMTFKPRLVIETGTANGFGTLAIASALDFNKRGRMITVDLLFCNAAKILAAKYGLSDRITFVQSESIEYLCDYREDKKEIPDFAFLDSEVDVRHDEYGLLKQIGMHGIAVCHDTSDMRSDYKGKNKEYLEWKHKVKQLDEHNVIENPYSRGLFVIQN